MTKRLLILINIIILCSWWNCAVAIGAPQVDEEEYSNEGELSRCEYLTYNMEIAYGTPKAIAYADSLIEYIAETADGDVFYAITSKMTAYLALAQYKRFDEYMDSVVTATNVAEESTYYYYYMIYLKTLSYIEQGKYKLAIQEAQKLYDDSKAEAVEETSDVPQYVRNRCNALSSLGIANDEMGQHEEAIEKFFDEGIALCEKYGKDLLPMKLDIETYRMTAAQKLDDKHTVLKYLIQYENQISQFEIDAENTDYQYVSTNQYKLLLEVAYVETYCAINDPASARMHMEKAQSIVNEGDVIESSIAELNRAKAKYYSLIAKNDKAIEYADSAARYYKETSKPGQEVELLKIKLGAMHRSKMYADEYPVSQRIINLSDSLYNQRHNSQIEEMQTMMDVDKLESEKTKLAADRQLMVVISIAVVLVAMMLLIYFNYRKGKEKQKILSKQKVLLEEEVARQTAELRQQKSEIEQKNRDITDSIEYAERIQSSILPDLSVYKNYGIEGAFAFFIPCNIVSGDFYWATKHGDNIVVACSDCTGHGVPGAFVSMIGSTSLNEISSNPRLLEPSEMLEELDKNVFKVLGQSGGEARDGMDIAIMSYNPSTHIVKCAGAKRPVYLINAEGELTEYKGTKRSIGDTDEISRSKPFETIEFEVKKGDTLYMCSDGLGDQFGGQAEHGERGKRLMSGGLKRMLAKICQEDIVRQKAVAEKLYWEWRGTCPQLDDISLVGIRF